MMMIRLMISWCLCGLFLQPLAAQFPKDPYIEVYPERLFSEKQVLAAGMHKIVIWYDLNKKGEGDESGVPWFAGNQISYQQQRHIFPENNLGTSTYYKENGDKDYQLRYFYQAGKIGAIDHFVFDSLQDESQLYSYRYTYKGQEPFQMVKLHMQDKTFRLMEEYSFNKDKEIVRRRVSTHGRAKKLETAFGMEMENMMQLVAFGKDSKTVRSYQNMHDLVRTERTQYKDDLPISTKVLDGEQQLIATIGYAYEGETLVKKTYTYYGAGHEVEKEVIEYYNYNYQTGLLETIIIEEGETQIVYTFQYTEEY
jgi:hypothetical protein